MDGVADRLSKMGSKDKCRKFVKTLLGKGLLFTYAKFNSKTKARLPIFYVHVTDICLSQNKSGLFQSKMILTALAAHLNAMSSLREDQKLDLVPQGGLLLVIVGVRKHCNILPSY